MYEKYVSKYSCLFLLRVSHRYHHSPGLQTPKPGKAGKDKSIINLS